MLGDPKKSILPVGTGQLIVKVKNAEKKLPHDWLGSVFFRAKDHGSTEGKRVKRKNGGTDSGKGGRLQLSTVAEDGVGI